MGRRTAGKRPLIFSNDNFRNFARTILLYFFKVLVVMLVLVALLIILLGITTALRIIMISGDLTGFVGVFIGNHPGIALFAVCACVYYLFCGCWRHNTIRD